MIRIRTAEQIVAEQNLSASRTSRNFVSIGNGNETLENMYKIMDCMLQNSSIFQGYNQTEVCMVGNLNR